MPRAQLRRKAASCAKAVRATSGLVGIVADGSREKRTFESADVVQDIGHSSEGALVGGAGENGRKGANLNISRSRVDSLILAAAPGADAVPTMAATGDGVALINQPNQRRRMNGNGHSAPTFVARGTKQSVEGRTVASGASAGWAPLLAQPRCTAAQHLGGWAEIPILASATTPPRNVLTR